MNKFIKVKLLSSDEYEYINPMCIAYFETRNQEQRKYMELHMTNGKSFLIECSPELDALINKAD